MNRNVYRWCAVPKCSNTSIKTPNKLFINVPMKKNVRNMWLNLARRDPAAISINSVIYICEDHFDLPNDMENYIQYHVMGSVSQVRMKSGCIPTKFECQRDGRKRTSSTTERPYVIKKQRKMLIEDSEKDFAIKSTPTKHLKPAVISSESSDIEHGHTAGRVHNLTFGDLDKNTDNIENMTEKYGSNCNVDLSIVKQEDIEIKLEMDPCNQILADVGHEHKVKHVYSMTYGYPSGTGKVEMMAEKDGSDSNVDLSTVKQEDIEIKLEVEPCKQILGNDGQEHKVQYVYSMTYGYLNDTGKIEMRAEKDGSDSNVDLSIVKQEDIEIKLEIEPCNQILSDVGQEHKVEHVHSMTHGCPNDTGKVEMMTEKDGSGSNVDLSIVKQEDIEIKKETEACNKLLYEKTERTGKRCDLFEADKDTNIGLALKQLKKETDDDVTFLNWQYLNEPLRQETVVQKAAIYGGTPHATASSTRESVASDGSTRHLEIDIQEEEKPYACSYCSVRFSRKDDLVHIMKHTGEKSFACSKCDFKFVQRRSLSRHVKVKNTGEKSFACYYCEFKCVEKRSLNNHLMTHTGERRYACGICNYKCIHKSSLNRHIKTHTGEKPYACSYCEFKCIEKHNLINHVKIHTHPGEKPYACSYCDFRCVQRNYLNKHLKKHTE